MPARIFGLGVVVVDHVLTIDRLPDPDTKGEASDSHFQVGGPVPTALAQLRKFGHESHFQSEWGDDPLGDFIESTFADDGISFPSHCRGDSASNVAQIWLEQNLGRRTLVAHRNRGEHLAQQFNADALDGFDALHLDGWPSEVTLVAAQAMQSQNGKVFLDTGSPKPGIEELLRHVDVVNAPKRFCQEMFEVDSLEKGARLIASFGPKIVTVTDGVNGAVIFAGGTIHQQPAIEIPVALDTNGAGDVFSAGLIHAVLENKSPQEIVLFAATAAGLKCMGIGNRGALPTLEAVQSRIEHDHDQIG